MFLLTQMFACIWNYCLAFKENIYVGDSYDGDNMKQFVLIILVFRSCFANSIHDVTTSAFGSAVQGKLAAFGDFNSDKHTDIFTLSDDGKENVSSILFSEPHLLTSQYVNYLQQFMPMLMKNNKCTCNCYVCRVCEFNSNKVIVIWSFDAQPNTLNIYLTHFD